MLGWKSYGINYKGHHYYLEIITVKGDEDLRHIHTCYYYGLMKTD